jgi:hypothetical protein
MPTVNTLGLRAVLITVLVLVILWGVYSGIKYFLFPQSTEPSVTATPATETESTATDTDADGLPDVFEPLYNTNVQQSDTDSDGTGDFAEIEQGRDPARPGPNDQSKPLTGGLAGSTTTYTEKYLAQLPEDISREDILVKERIEAFIELNKGPLLPEVAEVSLKTTSAVGKEAVDAYLKSVSATHNPQLSAITNDEIEQALTAQLSLQPQAMQEIIKKLESNVTVLRATPTPQETKALHRQLIAASEALLANTKLLQGIDSDFVGSLIASKKIDELAAVFADIATQVTALEAKYQL